MTCRDCQRPTTTGYFTSLTGGPRHKQPLCDECWQRYVRRVTTDAVHGSLPAGQGSGRVLRKSIDRK